MDLYHPSHKGMKFYSDLAPVNVANKFNITAAGWSVLSAYKYGKIVVANISGTFTSSGGVILGSVDDSIAPVIDVRSPLSRTDFSGTLTVNANKTLVVYPSTNYETQAVATTVTYITV